MPLALTGIHHVTAVTANIRENRRFYTDTLGMRLVKRTVNQDDVSAYHLFYADGFGSPGTDVTFFDWPAPPERRGTRTVVRTGLRVTAGEASLRWWAERFRALGVRHRVLAGQDHDGGRPTLEFEDPEGQRLALVADETRGDDPRFPVHPWDRSPVPAEHQVRGLGPIALSVPDLAPTDRVLTEVLSMRRVREYPRPDPDDVTVKQTAATVHVYAMGDGGSPAAELHVAVEPRLPVGRQGAGGVHHVAFRVPTFEDYDAWNERLARLRVPTSGPVDRYYFRSLYFREPNGVLFELATDGPGFATDEPSESLGERLALPPFLEGRRREIEAGLKPI